MTFKKVILKIKSYVEQMTKKEKQKVISDSFIIKEIKTPFGILTIYKHKGLL